MESRRVLLVGPGSQSACRCSHQVRLAGAGKFDLQSVYHSVDTDADTPMIGACFNRRMRKTARPVVWDWELAKHTSTP